MPKQTAKQEGGDSKVASPKKVANTPLPRYVGPAGKKITVPSLSIIFEPHKLDTPEKVKALLKQRPGLARYFTVDD